MSLIAPSEAEAPSEARVPSESRERRRNLRVALICGATFVVMTGAAFAAVPLYRAFCQLTGFDGATRRADTASETVIGQALTVSFDTNVRAPIPFCHGNTGVSKPSLRFTNIDGIAR